LVEEYKTEIENMDQKNWSNLIAKFDDANIFQTWEHGAYTWGEKRLSHIILHKGGEVIAAAQLYLWSLPIIKIGFAHLSWGPLWRVKGQEIKVANLRAIIEALHQEYVLKRRLLLRIRFNEVDTSENKPAIDTINEMVKAGFISKTNEYKYRTIRVKLDRSYDEIRAGLRKSWRRHLRKAEENNLEIVEGTQDELFKIFKTLYNDMISRKKFTRYLMSVNQYAAIQKALPESLKLRVFLAKSDGKYAAGSILSAMGNNANSILSASSTLDVNKNLRSSYLLDWSCIKWLKENGFTYLDLRGYNPESYNGPSYYKAGLGGDDIYFVGTFECCQNIFSNLLVKVGSWVDHKLELVKSMIRKMLYFFRIIILLNVLLNSDNCIFLFYEQILNA
jgi:lipid II:glycine glycyltransferase (peptidoglycan interpeptide bridge formation enzyme)